MTLQDDQSTDLTARYPGVEKGVTALLRRFKEDELGANDPDDFAAYVAHMHAVAAISGNPRTHFVDAQAVAWEFLAGT